MSWNQWQPTETVSSDGKTLQYLIPEESIGNIHFYLADQKIATDADYVTAQVNGYQFNLPIVDGYVAISGWFYEQKGTFTTWKGGVATTTDIQTGLNVPGGVCLYSTRTKGVEGVDVLDSTGLLLTITESDPGSTIIYETTAQAPGSLTVKASTYWLMKPTGLYYTIVGQGKDKQYLLPTSSGEFKIPCLKGQTFQIKFVWPDQGYYGGGKG